MRSFIILFAALIALVFSAPAFATILNVPDDHETIQGAINASEDGDTVLVQPGEYVENIDFNGHNIVVGSLFITTGDTAFVERTIIDGNGENTVIQIASGEDARTMLTGFTIHNGSAEIGGGIFIRASSPHLDRLIVQNCYASLDFGGGGIYIDRNASPMIENVVVRYNSCGSERDWTGNGAGIVCYEGASPNFENCRIDSNRAGRYGGGLYLTNSNVTLTNVLIRGNTSLTGGGAGIKCVEANLILEQVTISDNVTNSLDGGGIFCVASRMELTDVTFTENIAGRGGALDCWGNFDIAMTDCRIIGNQSTQAVWTNFPTGGGAIFTQFGGGIMTFNRVLIVDNRAVNGGAIFVSSYSDMAPEFHFTNTTFARNTATTQAGGLYIQGGTIATFENSIITSNRPNQIFARRIFRLNTLTVSYSNIQGGRNDIVDNHNIDIEWLEGNIDTDPLFVDPDEGDYHLTEDSPCIDAGDPDREPDPDGTRADMGAFYFHQVNPDPDIDVEPDSISFPLIAVGAWEEVVLTIRNFGGDTLDVSSQAILEEEDPFFIIDGEGAFQLMPQTTHETTIRFEPMEEGDFEAVFRIECNDPDEEIVQIPIIGSAVLMIPDIEVDADSVYYGNLGIGITAERIVTISSIGNAPLSILDQYIVPDDMYFYIREGGGEALLEPDSTHETVVAFAPRAYGDFEALYVIESNDPDEGTIEIPLVGYVLDVDSEEQELPTEFALTSIYPNPFNSQTRLSYGLPEPAKVIIDVFDITGRRIATLVDHERPAGNYTCVWNASAMSPGIYLVRMQAGSYNTNKKVMLIR